MKIQNLTVHGDSQLIIKQVLNTHKVKEPHLIPYANKVKRLLQQFPRFKIEHVARSSSRHADALATLATKLCSIEGQQIDSVHVIRRDHHTPFGPADSPAQETLMVEEEIPWYHDIYQYITTGTFPGYDQEATRVKRA